MDISETIKPKSDQLNADDFLSGPKTVRIASVTAGNKEQPVKIGLEGDFLPFMPCKSMRRALVMAWGDNGAEWVGRSMTLYCDPDVMYGGVKVGGIRISHVSDIKSDMSLMLTSTRGKKKEFMLRKLKEAMYPTTDFDTNLPKWATAILAGKATADQVIAGCEKKGALTAEQKQAITALPVKPVDAPTPTPTPNDDIFEG